MLKNTKELKIVLLTIVIFSIISSSGTFWDFWWHNNITSDTGDLLEDFWIPPHTLVYSSVIIIGLLSFILFLKERNIKAPFGIASLGFIIVLIAGGFDSWWHQAYGIDIGLSPPHIMVVAGGLLIGSGILLKLIGFYEKFKNTFSKILLILFIATGITMVRFAFILFDPFLESELSIGIIGAFSWGIIFVGFAFFISFYFKKFGLLTLMFIPSSVLHALGTQTLYPFLSVIIAIFILDIIFNKQKYKPSLINTFVVSIVFGSLVFLSFFIISSFSLPIDFPIKLITIILSGALSFLSSDLLYRFCLNYKSK